MIFSIVTNIFIISIMCSLVILPVMFARRYLGNLTGTKWRVVVWMIILIRLCVPVITHTPIGIVKDSYGVNAYASQENKVVEVNYNNHINNTSNTINNTDYTSKNTSFTDLEIKLSSNSSSKNILCFIYVIGVLISLIFLITNYIATHYHIRKLKKCSHANVLNLVDTLRLQMGIKNRIDVLVDDKITTPMFYGLFNPCIVLPTSTLSDDINKLEFIFLHELTHYKKLDIIKICILEIAKCINWFNPILYLVKTIIIQDIEIACDENVLSKSTKRNSYEYSTIIAEYSSGKVLNNVVSVGFSFGNCKTLKARLTMIKNRKNYKTRILDTIIIICIASLLLSCTTTKITIPKSISQSFDWRDEGIVLTPQNQGEHSTGAVFAAIGMFESSIARETGQLINLSEQQFIDNTDYIKLNKGISVEKVLDFATNNKIVKESVLPYSGQKNSQIFLPSSKETGYLLQSWNSIILADKEADEQLKIIKEHLISYGPVVTNIGFYEDMKAYQGGIYKSDNSKEALYGHWVTIVGWKDNKIGNDGYWIVKESLGTEWGEEGYCKIAYNDACGINDYILFYIESTT